MTDSRIMRIRLWMGALHKRPVAQQNWRLLTFQRFWRCEKVLNYRFDRRYICAMLIGYARVSTDEQTPPPKRRRSRRAGASASIVRRLPADAGTDPNYTGFSINFVMIGTQHRMEAITTLHTDAWQALLPNAARLARRQEIYSGHSIDSACIPISVARCFPAKERLHDRRSFPRSQQLPSFQLGARNTRTSSFYLVWSAKEA
jgi:hypothetical protein